MTESLSVLASVAEQRDHFPAVMAALLDCFRGNGGARLLQVGNVGAAVLSCLGIAWDGHHPAMRVLRWPCCRVCRQCTLFLLPTAELILLPSRPTQTAIRSAAAAWSFSS